MAANYPPLSFREDGELVGIEVDLAREVVRETGLTVTIKQVPWAELIPALQSGKIDVIMSGMSVTDARAQQVTFVEPYLRTGQMVLDSRTGRAAARTARAAARSGATHRRGRRDHRRAVRAHEPAAGAGGRLRR